MYKYCACFGLVSVEQEGGQQGGELCLDSLASQNV